MTKETHHGDPDSVGVDPLSELEVGFHGTLLRPGQRGYEDARALSNA